MIEFDKLEEIHDKVCEILDPIDLAYYQNEFLSTNDLKEQIKIAGKYVSLHCKKWICQDCFSTNYAALEFEVVCQDCGTVDNVYHYYCGYRNKVVFPVNLWSNSVQRNPVTGMHYDMKNTHAFAIDNRLDAFTKLAKASDVSIAMLGKMQQDYKRLEEKFESMQDIHKRKNFFMNKLILQRLMEHYELIKEAKKRTYTVKQQYKLFDLMKWP